MQRLLFLILFSNLIAQNQNTAIDDWFNTIKQYTRNVIVPKTSLNKSNMTFEEKQKTRIPDANMETLKKIETMDKGIILDLARKFNKAMLENPVLFKKNMIDDEIEVEQEIKKGRYDVMSIDIFTTILKDNMKKKGYEKQAEFLDIPLILKVRINSIDTKTYKTKAPVSFSMPKTVIGGSVIDIIKGESTFNKGDELEFYYMDMWKKTENQFELNQEYLVCLAIKITEKRDYELALVPNVNTDGIYLVKDNILLDETKYFGTDTRINWGDFKSRFLNKYVNF